jgi:hypothetical protein
MRHQVANRRSNASLLGVCAKGAVLTAPRKERHMKKYKDLKACIACLRQWQADEALDQGQKEALEGVIRQLRKLSQHATAERKDVFSVVREVTEILWKAFARK